MGSAAADGASMPPLLDCRPWFGNVTVAGQTRLSGVRPSCTVNILCAALLGFETFTGSDVTCGATCPVPGSVRVRMGTEMHSRCANHTVAQFSLARAVLAFRHYLAGNDVTPAGDGVAMTVRVRALRCDKDP